MIKLYPFLSAALSIPIADATYHHMETFALMTVDGLQKAPYQYRLLFAYLFTPLSKLVGSYAASWLFWFVCLSLLAYLIKRTSNSDTALIMALTIIPVIVLFQPAGAMWNILEAVFIAAALIAARERPLLLYPIVFVASLNRETAVFIPLMVYFMKRDKGQAAGLFLIWATTYGGIRLIIGPVPLHVTLAEIAAVNLGQGLLRFILGFILFGWLFWYAARGWKTAPEWLKRAAYVVPCYLAVAAVFGIWYEWRLILSMYPLLVPLVGVAIGAMSND